MIILKTKCPKCNTKHFITTDTFKCDCGSFCFNGKWSLVNKKIKDTKKMIQGRIDVIVKRHLIEKIMNRYNGVKLSKAEYKKKLSNLSIKSLLKILEQYETN